MQINKAGNAAYSLSLQYMDERAIPQSTISLQPLMI
jgi:hypothetical protein